MKQKRLANCWQGVAIRNTVRGAIAASTLLFSIPVAAQIVPDATLPVNSIVTPNGNTLTINGGSRAGSNLFHSFQEFSLPTGSEAFFNNAVDVQNIFSRVTGSNISNIDGLIRANGGANLFLLNPAGIVFGPNARLNIGGSFFGTTANSIQFADGVQFSATSPSASPLLTISVPVGLQMGQNPGAIAHRSTSEFQVRSGQTLALVGSNVSLEGGRIVAPGARVELVGSGSSTQIGLANNGSILQLNVPPEALQGNVSLRQGSQIDVLAPASGSIAIQAGQISMGGAGARNNLVTGSSGSASTNAPSNNIDLVAAGTIRLENSRILSQVNPNTVGNGGNINVTAESVYLSNGAALDSTTRGNGNGGRININARDQIAFDGGTAFSGVVSLAFSAGNSGDVNLSARDFAIFNGGQLASGTYGLGNAGSVNINARESVTLDGTGIGSRVRNASGLFSVSLGIGNGSAVNVSTQRLTLTNGGLISATASASGNAGKIDIQATESVLIRGAGGTGVTSGLYATSFNQEGRGGDIRVTTGNMTLVEGGLIDASTRGPGDGGDIVVNANTFSAVSGGQLTTTTAGSGRAGNIIVNVTDSLTLAGSDPTYDQRLSNSLRLLGGSQVSAAGNVSGFYANTTDKATGQGGSIVISAGQVTLQDRAQLSASTQGTGDAGSLVVNANALNLFNDGGITSASRGTMTGAGDAGSIRLQVRDRATLNNGTLATSTTNGQGGRITLNADQLQLDNNSLIDSSTFGFGNAGAIDVSSNSIRLNQSNLSSQSSGSGNGGTIDLIANSLDLDNNASLSTAASNTGQAGNLNLQANRTTLLNNSQITTRSTGTGDGGTVNLSGDTLTLRQGSSINAATAFGNGGNLNLNLSEFVHLRNLSPLTAEAGGTGNGGNITLNAPIIVGLENSDIIANAFQGNGGNIQINTQGIFGLQNRPQLTPDSDISASSQFGISGTVNVSVLNVNQQNIVEPPPSNFVSTDQVAANSCLARQGNSQGTLAIAGNGGLPETPETAIVPYQVVQVQATNTPQATPRPPESKATSTATPTWKPGDPIIEATEFSVNAQGQVVLTAKGNTAGAIAQPQPIPCQPN